jgi:hypothetical protein
MYTCRECEQPINQASEVCPYCGADVQSEAAAEQASGAAKGVMGKRIAVWGTMILAMWGFLWFILPERATDAASEAESRAVSAVETAGTVLRAHHDAHGSYPNALDGLTPPSFRTLREAAQRAQSLGYRLEYTPGPPAEDGNVHTFTLLARPGNYSYRNFFANENGMVRWTRENRPATAQDHPL